MFDFFSPQSLSFFIISFVVILSSIIAVITPNIKTSLISLFFTFFSICGYYVLLYSEFLAILQVIIYVGAILILLLFAVLLTDVKFLKGESLFKQKISSIVLVCVFFILVPLQIILKSEFSGENRVLKKSYDYTSQIGMLLLTKEFILFEVAGVLMLIALIGASVMIKRKEN